MNAAGINIQLDLADGLPVLSAHHGQLQQVMLNLFNNAADAMRTAGNQTRILGVKSTITNNGGVGISVKDNGLGIDPKNIDRIFDAFFTTKTGGMGMGLAICKSIIESHGGTLSASSGVANGSVFVIALPSNR
jgi:signal transduction histidine kinase